MHHADEITGGRGYDVVIDASGSVRAVKGLLDIAAKGGTVVYGAMYPEHFEMPLNLSDYLYLKELTITGVFVSPYAFPRALQMLPHLELDEMTQAVYPLEDATEVTYQVSGAYTPAAERGQRWNDPALGLKWPLEVSLISAKDAAWPLLEGVTA